MDSKIGTVIFAILVIFLLKIGMEKSMNQSKQNESTTKTHRRSFVVPKVSSLR